MSESRNVYQERCPILVHFHANDRIVGLRLNARPLIMAGKIDCKEHSKQIEKRLATGQEAKRVEYFL